MLARRHRGPVPLLHVDAYRLRDAGARALDLADLDLEDALEQGVVVVEWGEGLVEELSPSRLAVVLSRPDGDGRDGRGRGTVAGPRRSGRTDPGGRAGRAVRHPDPDDGSRSETLALCPRVRLDA